MQVLECQALGISSAEDIVSVRQAVRKKSISLGLGLVDQTKFVTAASELARNTLDYGGGGTVQIELVRNECKTGIRLVFEDRGPGIADIDQAMTDGFSTSGGMGLGLSGAKRLSHEFEISSRPDEGTRVSILRWK
jgi:serine/threonine-protein kinase RsbT